jgi:hypothetical protein
MPLTEAEVLAQIFCILGIAVAGFAMILVGTWGSHW